MMRPALKAILRVVAEECCVSEDCIVGPERWREYARARHVFAHAAKSFGHRQERIAKILNRHHSTIKHSLDKAPSCLEPELSRVTSRINRTRVAA